MAKKKKKFSLTKKQKKYLGKATKGLAIGGLVAASLFGGPLAVAIATPLAAGLAAAGTKGDKKKKFKVAKKFLVGGAALTAGTAALSALSGQGLGGGLLSAGKSLLGGGSKSSGDSASDKAEELLSTGLGQRTGNGEEPGLGIPPGEQEDPGLPDDAGQDEPDVDVDGKPVPEKSNTAVLALAAGGAALWLLSKKKAG